MAPLYLNQGNWIKGKMKPILNLQEQILSLWPQIYSLSASCHVQDSFHTHFYSLQQVMYPIAANELEILHKWIKSLF